MTSKSNPIQIWHIDDAPEQCRRLCPPQWLAEGAEVCAVWVVLRPAPYERNYWIGWAESKEIGTEFHELYLPEGSLLTITAMSRYEWFSFTPSAPRDESRVIRVWDYETAHREGTCHTVDDADWVAILPPALSGAKIPWMADGTNFGCCGVDVHELPDGGEMHIGCHA